MTFKSDSAADRDALLHELERIVDRAGLSQVLDSLHTLCGLKAAHIAENWQDATLAKEWERAGSKVLTAYMAVPNTL